MLKCVQIANSPVIQTLFQFQLKLPNQTQQLLFSIHYDYNEKIKNYVEDDTCLMKNKCPVCFTKLVHKFKKYKQYYQFDLVYLSLVITNENESRG
jgi:hypothetical protein